MEALQTNHLDSLFDIDFKGLSSMIIKTTVKVLKKRRDTKEPIPERFQNITKITYSLVSIGNDYEKNVNRRLGLENKTPDFKAQDSYCWPIDSRKIIYKHNNENKFYLRYFSNLVPQEKARCIYLDSFGDELDLNTIWDLKENVFSSKPSINKNQGLGNFIKVNNVCLENVLYLKHGNYLYYHISDELFQKIVLLK